MAELHTRVGRGRAIAAVRDSVERITKNVYSVQSQSGVGAYLVRIEKGQRTCTCPDFAAQAVECKHVLAVRFHVDGVPETDAELAKTRRPRPTYRQDWPAYNRAQNSELRLFDVVLADHVEDVVDPRPQQVTGRPRLPFNEVLFCAVEKVYHRRPLRLAFGIYERACSDKKISCAPSQNMPSSILRMPEVTPILHELIEKSALALASIEDCFAVDSSGFRTNSFGDYCREKYGAPSHNVWLKAHIIVGCKTHIIPRVAVTQGHAADAPQFPGLVNGIVEAGFVLKEVYADKGYLSGENFAAVGKAGGTAYIMFKDNSRGRGAKRADRTPYWKQMWHRFQSDRGRYLSHYYLRENAEATFKSIKGRLGETISSKDPVAQVNELLCKVLSHNIQVIIHESFEHGIPLPGRDSTPHDLAATRPLRPRGREPEPSLSYRTAPAWSGEDN